MADFIVAVTGGVASGKSAATRAFEDLGVTVADADVAARAVVEPGQPALAEVAAAFGPQFLLADGHLDRAAMRERVFADPAAKARLAAAMGHDPAQAMATTLKEEKEHNTFMRLDSPGVLAQLRQSFPDLPEQLDAKTVFTHLRELRNNW